VSFGCLRGSLVCDFLVFCLVSIVFYVGFFGERGRRVAGVSVDAWYLSYSNWSVCAHPCPRICVGTPFYNVAVQGPPVPSPERALLVWSGGVFEFDDCSPRTGSAAHTTARATRQSRSHVLPSYYEYEYINLCSRGGTC
jgi:hypothetical protein